MRKTKNAIILCSGGLDSSVTSYYVKNKLKHDKLIILFFNYNQRTLDREKEASKRIAKKLNAKFIEINLKWLGDISNSLINTNKKAKKLTRKQLKDTKKESEKFYVPCRNTIFLINAIALAEALFIKEKKIYDIFVGFKNEGKESYPDTTIKFVKQMNKLSKISTNFKGKIIAPLIKKDKEDIILLGKKLNLDLSKTYSCYVSNNIHCGSCLACQLRKAGFYWANLKDKTRYKNK